MTVKELQKIINEAVEKGKGDYKVIVLWRDGGGCYNGYDDDDRDVKPVFDDNERWAKF